MLDDLKYIHQRDAQDALGVAEKQIQQLSYKFDFELGKIAGVENIVLAGMGGSALGAVFLQSWPGLALPFEIVRNYSIPGYVGPKTLFMSSSYSGNTEETLAALAQAEEKGAQIVVMAAGGKLAEIAKAKNYPLLVVPQTSQPRMAAFYTLVGIVQVLESLGILDNCSPVLAETADWLAGQVNAWRPDVPTNQNPAKKLAEELAGKTVIIYAGPLMWPAANKMKIWTNENAKNLAWANQYPEFNHNEFIGWSSHPIQKPFVVVDIRSSLEHPRVQKRFEVTERMLSGKRPAPYIISPEGDSVIKQLMWAAIFCDFVTIYLALLNGLNPTPVELVEKFKAELDK